MCGRWFCKKHLEPRLAFIRDLEAIVKYPELRVFLDSEWDREDGHPDFEYSRRKLAELSVEEQRRSELIEEALNRMNAHYRGRPTQSVYVCPKCGAKYKLHEEMLYCEKCGSRVKGLPRAIAESKHLMEELRRYGNGKEIAFAEENPKKGMASEGKFHFVKGDKYSERRARKLSRKVKAIGVLAVSLIAVSIFVLSWTNFFAQIILPHFVDTSQVEIEIFELINEERVNRGLPTLLKDSALTRIAFQWSKNLTELGTLTHGDFESRIAQIGYSTYQCGEIIAMYGGWSSNLGREFVDMWLGSIGHRDIMLTPLSGYMGVGASKIGTTFYAVVDFRFS